MSEVTINLCWMGIHNWSNWKDFLGSDCKVCQFKECECCGKKKYLDYNIQHQWGEWDEGSVTTMYDTGADPEKDIPSGRILVQRKVCSKCKEVKVRKENL